MRTHPALLAIAALLLASPLGAQTAGGGSYSSAEAASGRWRLMAVGAGDTLWMDTETVRVPSRGVYRVWLKESIGWGSKQTRGGKLYQYALSLRDYDCTNARTRPLEVLYYHTSGDLVESESWPDSASWLRQVPESQGELIARHICEQLARAKRPEEPG